MVFSGQVTVSEELMPDRSSDPDIFISSCLARRGQWRLTEPTAEPLASLA